MRGPVFNAAKGAFEIDLESIEIREDEIHMAGAMVQGLIKRKVEAAIAETVDALFADPRFQATILEIVGAKLREALEKGEP